jgi:hypothetical protein
VASDGRATGGQRDDREAENVVQFTGDWYGPPESLIPIGTSPDPDNALADEPEALRAFDASAFWGEESASLQEAMRGPGGVAPVDTPATALPVQPLEPPIQQPEPMTDRWAWVRASVRVRAVVAGAAACLCLLLAAVIVGVGAGGSAPRGRLTAETEGGATGAVGAATVGLHLGQLHRWGADAVKARPDRGRRSSHTIRSLRSGVKGGETSDVAPSIKSGTATSSSSDAAVDTSQSSVAPAEETAPVTPRESTVVPSESNAEALPPGPDGPGGVEGSDCNSQCK